MPDLHVLGDEMDLEKKPWFKLLVAALCAPLAVYIFHWAGFEWTRSAWGWIIFLSADAGLTSFIGTVLSIGLILWKPRHAPG
jgi:hypothetical protein